MMINTLPSVSRKCTFSLLVFLMSGPNTTSSVPQFIDIHETTPAGTLLLTFDGKGDDRWSWDTSQDPWLNNYLEFSFDKFHGLYKLEILQPVDLEGIFKKYAKIANRIPLTFYNSSRTKTEITLRNGPVNEFVPRFLQETLQFNTTEATDVHLNISVYVVDDDVLENAYTNVYKLRPVERYKGTANDAARYLKMSLTSVGMLTGGIGIDYEALPKEDKKIYGLITVGNRTKRSSAPLVINITDIDDLPPVFDFPGCPSPECVYLYSGHVSPHYTGPLLDWHPREMKARDGDALNYAIEYSMDNTTKVTEYFKVDKQTGRVFLTLSLQDMGVDYVAVTIWAHEISLKAHHTKAGLHITKATPPQMDEDDYIIDKVFLTAVVIMVTIILLSCCITISMSDRLQIPTDSDTATTSKPVAETAV